MEACSSCARTGSGKLLCVVDLLSVVMMGSWLLVRGFVQLRGMERGGVLAVVVAKMGEQGSTIRSESHSHGQVTIRWEK